MKIVRRLGIFEATEEYDYVPTPAEMQYWYSGTHTGLNRDNPYAPKRSRVTKVKYKFVSQ